jgi:hypothetical protein
MALAAALAVLVLAQPQEVLFLVGQAQRSADITSQVAAALLVAIRQQTMEMADEAHMSSLERTVALSSLAQIL